MSTAAATAAATTTTATAPTTTRREGKLPLRARHLAELHARLDKFHNVVASNNVLPLSDAKRVKDYELRMQRRASVLVPLVNVDGEASVLFTVRSGTVSTHRGQVAFPGGHLEPGESSADAALRELREETALTGVVLGPWKMARAITGTMVTPMVGVLVREGTASLQAAMMDEDHILDMSPDQVSAAGAVLPAEVASAFSLPVRHLCDPANRTRETLSPTFRATRFTGGPEPVWGLSAFFLEGVLHEVAAVLGLEFAPATLPASSPLQREPSIR